MITPEHLTAYLRAHPGVSAAVGAVGTNSLPITGELKGALAALMPRRAIVVTSSGGPELPGRNHDLARGRMDVRCYGKTISDAWALHNDVYQVLRRGGRRAMNGQQMVTVRPSGGGIQDRGPEGDWPFVFSEYTLTMTEETR